MTWLPVLDGRFISLDLGLVIVCWGLLRGLFRDYTTLEELCTGTQDEHIRWKDEVMSLPVFTGSSRGGRGYKEDVPMSYNRAATFVRTTAAACGYGGRWVDDVRNGEN